MSKNKTTKKIKRDYHNSKKVSKNEIISPTYSNNSTEYALERYRKIRDQNRRNQLQKEVEEIDIL